jgi:hypothetical protein
MPITLRIKKSCSEDTRLLGQVGGNSNKPKTVTGTRYAEVAIQPATGESPRLIPPECAVEDPASIVEPGIFIVDDGAMPPPITFLVLPRLLLASEELRGMIDDAGAIDGHGRRNRAD